MILKKGGEDAYFVASNSKRGFFSYYDACFDDARVGHIYAIKGGPGTGKSRFMRDVASVAKDLSVHIEYIYCSSDPSSLDGIILNGTDECIALLDATAPHAFEPKNPGVREELVNLGMFWDRSVLLAHREDIDILNREKGEAYRRAYRYLAGVGEMLAVRDALVLPFVRRNAIARYAEKLLREIPIGRGYSARPSLMRSVGMQGTAMLDGLFYQASRRVLISNCRGIARYLMEDIVAIAKQRRQPIRVSHDPIDPDVIDAILFCDCGILFAVMDGTAPFPCEKSIGMRRFLDTARMGTVREEITHAERVRRAMMEGAVEALAMVKRAHFQLEDIYSSAMDFSAKEIFTKNFCQQLFDLQNL